MIILNRLCCSLSFQRECAFPIVTFYFLFRVWIISCRLTAPCVFSQYAGLCKHSRRIAHFIKWILWCQGVFSMHIFTFAKTGQLTFDQLSCPHLFIAIYSVLLIPLQ